MDSMWPLFLAIQPFTQAVPSASNALLYPNMCPPCPKPHIDVKS